MTYLETDSFTIPSFVRYKSFKWSVSPADENIINYFVRNFNIFSAPLHARLQLTFLAER